MPKSVFTDANKAVVETLVSARKAAGLRQEDLAARLKKPQSFISRIETGERRIDIVELYAVATAIGVDPAKLYREMVKRFPKDVPI